MRVEPRSDLTGCAGARSCSVSRASATCPDASEYSCWRPRGSARTRPPAVSCFRWALASDREMPAISASADPECGAPPIRICRMHARLGSPMRRPIAARSASGSMASTLIQEPSNGHLTVLGLSSGIMPRRTPAAWVRVALLMFAVGWGANQFSPMLIVYRHALGLSAGEIAGLFAIYAATLIPGLLAGGPLSDRFGRRACVLPFAALSPVATLLLVVGPHSLPLIAAGRALAGLCSGMVIGPATAWVQDLSGGDALSARRAALALSAGFGLGPVVAAFLAQWAGDPLVVPYLPHLALGTAARASGLTAPGPRRGQARPGAGGQRWPPAALRTREFWLGVALPAPFVFGSVSLAIVVLPEEVTSARTLSAGYAGLMTILAFAAGIGVQPAARRLTARRPRAGIIAGLGAAAVGA